MPPVAITNDYSVSHSVIDAGFYPTEPDNEIRQNAQCDFQNTPIMKVWMHTQPNSITWLLKPDFSDSPRLSKAFAILADRWKSETGGLSNISRRIRHIAYLQIIAMGQQAIPFMLKDFQDGKYEDWFWALYVITQENPIPPGAEGNVQAMAHAWIQWGKKNKCLPEFP